MLHLFRKYQKYIFLITTIVIVLSFGFFGTYGAISQSWRGGNVKDTRSYVVQMADFLKTEEWMQGAKLFSANYLNDGVITKEWLETGMGALVYDKFRDHFQQGFTEQLEKEKLYTPYVHANTNTLSAEMIWAMLAPEIPEKLQAHQATTPEKAFATKVDLLLAQKRFPPAYLSQVLRYQERENLHIQRDLRLAKDNLSLFGYENLSDWLGSDYVETLAQAIIEMAAIARKEGHRVSKSEAYTQLLHKSQKAYEVVSEHMQLPVRNGQEFFALYLRQLGMREPTVVKIWEDITLFRRLMHSVGNAALVDTSPLEDFYAHAHENVTLELFQMSPEFRFTNSEALERFESYLAAVSDRPTDSLQLPSDYLPIEDIEARAPELVGKRYALYYGEVSKKALQGNVTVKETWDWECDKGNWQMLKQQFPELANSERETEKSPFEILEDVSPKTRQLIDAYARRQIVDKHPEWIDEACRSVMMKEHALFLTPSSVTPFAGIVDTAPLGEVLDTHDEILAYSQDQEHFYRILVQERSEKKEVLSYQEALQAGVLDALNERMGGPQLVSQVLKMTKSPAHRFADWLSAHRRGEEFVGALADQWTVQKRFKTITRATPEFISVEAAEGMESNSLSEIAVDSVEGAYYFRFVERGVNTTVPMDKVLRFQKMLSEEARRHYFQNLLPTLINNA